MIKFNPIKVNKFTIMILIIDNYDSFTYNIYQYVGSFDNDVNVVKNDMITFEELKKLKPKKIIISPGLAYPKILRFH